MVRCVVNFLNHFVCEGSAGQIRSGGWLMGCKVVTRAGANIGRDPNKRCAANSPPRLGSVTPGRGCTSMTVPATGAMPTTAVSVTGRTTDIRSSDNGRLIVPKEIPRPLRRAQGPANRPLLDTRVRHVDLDPLEDRTSAQALGHGGSGRARILRNQTDSWRRTLDAPCKKCFCTPMVLVLKPGPGGWAWVRLEGKVSKKPAEPALRPQPTYRTRRRKGWIFDGTCQRAADLRQQIRGSRFE